MANDRFDENAASNWSLYPYNPAKPLPIVFATIIFILGIVNVWQNFFKYKWKRFGFIMTWASAVWSAGFVCRAISQYQPRNIGMYIAQYVMVLLGPPLYAASESFILGRLLAYVPYHAFIHPGRVLSTFVIISALIEALAANGAAQLSNPTLSESKQKTAYGLVEAALILQAALELCFIGLAVTLFMRCRKANTLPRNVRIMLMLITFTSAMMLVRCIVRAIEVFAAQSCHTALALPDSSCSYILTHEWPLFTFEVANITLFVIALTIWTPGAYIPASHKVYLDKSDGMTERLGPGFAKADKRPLIVTILDPFNLVGIISGHGQEVTPFWEEHHPEYMDQGKRRVVHQSAVASDGESRKDPVEV